MVHQALADKRPYLLLGLTAALAFFALRFAPFPELYLIPIKGFATAMLAVYAWTRSRGADGGWLAAAMLVAALGDMAMEGYTVVGGALFALFHLMLLRLFLRHRRKRLAPTQRALAITILVLTPIIGFLLPFDPQMKLVAGLYGLVLGAMVAAAWTSAFPRYRVGAGAVLFWLSDILIFAQMGPMMNSPLAANGVWPLYYLGQFLICTGIVQTLMHGPRDKVAEAG